MERFAFKENKFEKVVEYTWDKNLFSWIWKNFQLDKFLNLDKAAVRKMSN